MSTDVTGKKNATPVGIVGLNSAGVEANFAAVDASGNQQVVVNNTSANPVPVSRPSSYTSGTITALNGAVTLTVPEGQSAWDVYVSGTFSAGSTVQFQGSPDNALWFSLNGRRSGDANTNDTTTTLATDVPGGPGPTGGSPSNWRGNLAAIRYFRVIATSFFGGDSITIQISTSDAVGATFLNAAIPVGTNVIGQTYNTSASGNVAAVSGFNRLQVSPEPSDLFSDKFDTLDTAVRWTATNANGASAPVASGNLNMTGGTTAGAYTSLSSQPVFTQKANVQLSHGTTLKFESGTIITGAHRFWGFGTAGANTVANPLTDAVGWEIDTTGTVNAVVYGGGTKLYSQALPTPIDGKIHRYSLTWRTDKITFYLDSGDVQSAVASGYIPNVQILPARFHVITGTATTAPTLQVTAVGISDTGRNSTAISDGVYGFRKATVTGNGGVVVSPIDGYKASYSAAITGLVAPSGSTDLFTITGSASKTVRITRIGISATQSNQNIVNLVLLKRSSANSGGASTSLTAVPHDSQNPAASAIISGYTANPSTLGTLVGNLRVDKLFIPATTPSGSAGIGSVAVLIIEFGNRPSQGLVLRGTNEVVAINLNGTTINGSSFDAYIEWTEE